MKKIKHILRVQFKSKNSAVMYDGSSFVNKSISDEVLIKRNKIDIIFYRSKKMQVCDVLDSPKSIIRMHLQKCLCFYLAVTGEIPDVRVVTYICDTEKYPIEHEKFTQTWKNCYAGITLSAEYARIIFDQKKGQIFYVMLTYFLKAQLDNFSHDRFRAAWSTLNAMYSYLADNKSKNPNESEKLRNFMQIIDIEPMENSLEIVKALDYDFWKSVDWYYLLIQKDKGKIKEYYCDCYNDKLILELVKKYAWGFSQKDKLKELNEALMNELERKIKMNIYNPVDRLKFIIRKECYSRRNRSFHAEKPYPLFVISNGTETHFENILTEIILLTFKDLFIAFAEKKDKYN